MTKQDWINKWKQCRLCPLHLHAKHHVLYRGSIPADLLLIGEAPGKTEDKLGKPFIGRSGQLLTTAIQRLGITSYCIANVVCCIPLNEALSDEEQQVVRPPSPEEAAACYPHIEELVALCKPKLIGLLGKEAEKYFKSTSLAPETPRVILRHPAYVLRRGGINSIEFKNFLSDFEKALSSAGVVHVNPFQQIGV